MTDYDFHLIALPVFGCRHIEAVPTLTAGTAFSIGGGFFLTAAHVMDVATEHPVCCMGVIAPGDAFPGHKIWAKSPITEIEHHREVDLAVFRCDGSPHMALPWLTHGANVLTPVICSGFPYAHDIENERLFTRAYSGSISASYQLFDLEAHPVVYELSFSAPRGLSGAPVLVRFPDKPPHVIGYVIKNGKSSMLVGSSTEVIKEGGKETVVEQYESLSFGLAVASDTVLDLKSNLIGAKIGEHLTTLGLA